MSTESKEFKAPTYKYHDELIQTAKGIVAPGKGILAADESNSTIGKRFESIKVDNTQDNRRAYRKLLFTTKGLEQYISAVILFEETLNELDDGQPLVKTLQDKGIILGIKVDKGTKDLNDLGETYTEGIDGLGARCAEYYKKGARFAKWRAVLKISNNSPTSQAIQENAYNLARYAQICQQNGLVPIVEPEILMDGDHNIAKCQFWTEKVVAACYKALIDLNVLLEGTLLKPNMVVYGVDCPNKPSGQQVISEVAKATVTALQRSVPAAVPGITFLSGGQSEEEASQHLNALNAENLGPRPWALTFSYGRALQQSCLKAWQGKKENVEAAQHAFLARAKANGEAALGKYKPSGSANAGANEGLHVKGYTY